MHHHSEKRKRLAGSAALPQDPEGNCLLAMLLPAHDGQEGAKETEDRGSVCRTLQEASHWLGEQDHAAAAKN